jgi:hypothetical protein
MLFGPLLASGQITPRKVDGSNYDGDQSHLEDGRRQREDQHGRNTGTRAVFAFREHSIILSTSM